MYRVFFMMFLLLLSHLYSSYLSPKEIEIFYHQGYFLKQRAVEKELLQALDEQSTVLLETIFSALETNVYPYQEKEQKALIGGAEVVFVKNHPGSISIKRMVGVGSLAPKLQNFLRSEKMVNTYFPY